MTETTEISADYGTQILDEGFPAVNLLPPEIAQARSLRTTRRINGILAACGVLAIAGLAAITVLDANNASEEVEQARERRVALDSQIGALADVPRAEEQVNTVRSAVEQATANEVDWHAAITSALASHPKDQVWFTQWSMTTGAPATPGSPASGPAIASLDVTGEARNLDEVAKWVLSWNTGAPGIQDARYGSASETTNNSDKELYNFTATASVNSELLFDRLAVPVLTPGAAPIGPGPDAPAGGTP